jgi:hypothetical protein
MGPVLEVNRAVVDTCMAVLQRWVLIGLDTDDHIDDPNAFSDKLISSLEWEVVEKFDVYATGVLPDEAPVSDTAFLEKAEDAERTQQSTVVDDDAVNGGGGKPRPPPLREQMRIAQEKRRSEADARAAREGIKVAIAGSLVAVDGALLAEIQALLVRCRKLGGTQADINGNGKDANNMWIVKPAAKSRGRGICTFNDLGQLLRYIDAGSGGANHWVVQKYMENPMTISNRKVGRACT